MYQFSHTWPYERMGNDYYFNECPFCGESSVLINIKQEQIEYAREGVKTHIVMPCCHERMDIEQIDDDYFWADRPLR